MLRSSVRRLLALAAAALSLPLLVAPPAHAAPPSYVALGDSYSSGVGTRTYLADGTSCQRSVYAFPSLIAAAKGYALNFRACSGAKVSDVTNTQLSALSAGDRLRDDLGRRQRRRLHQRDHHLRRAGLAQRLQGRGQQGPGLHQEHAAGRARRPLLLDPGQGAERHGRRRRLPPPLQRRGLQRPHLVQPLRRVAAERHRRPADSKLAAAAAARGFAFANPTSAFIGHAVCGDPEWLNGLSNPISESYHPNRIGHASGYTPLVSPLLTGSSLRVNAAVLARARAQAPALAAQQRHYAPADRSIRPERFGTPYAGRR